MTEPTDDGSDLAALRTEIDDLRSAIEAHIAVCPSAKVNDASMDDIFDLEERITDIESARRTAEKEGRHDLTVDERLGWLDDKVEGLLHVVEHLASVMTVAGHAFANTRRVMDETK